MTSTFLEMVFQNLMTLLPFVIVYSYERGVRWFLGCNPKELQPGFHWKIWFIHRVEIVIVIDDVLQLPTQSVITKDKKLVCFSVNIGYRINNAVKHWCGVTDFRTATLGLAMIHLAQRVRERTLDELMGDLKSLEKSLEGTLTTRFKDWGTEVFLVGFTDFAEVPQQYRVFGIGDHHISDNKIVL